MEESTGNLVSTSPYFMDGKQGKPLSLIMGPRPEVIKRVEPVTNNKHEKLTSNCRLIELTLRTKSKYYIYILEAKNIIHLVSKIS
jgi:hypothetical protein